MLLELKDLWVHYGRAEALRGISMQIEEGSIVTLLGANGAGKTTTLRTISGLKRPTSGEIWFQGERIDKVSPSDIVRRGIAHVPEGRQLFYNMTVQDNLQMGGYLLKSKRQYQKNLDELLQHFPAVRDRMRHKASDLSGGEQQMVAVCRALMSDPKVLLMDEPSLGLSPIMVDEIGKIVTEVNHLGVTIILVEQNARMALELAGSAYVMETGRVTMQGEACVLAEDENVIRCYLGG
jgi:branched-chain amino acid transport system ATP-binding protein